MNQKNLFLTKRGKAIKAFFVLISVVLIAVLGIVSNNHLLQAKGNAVTIGEAESLREGALSLTFKKEIEKTHSIYVEEKEKRIQEEAAAQLKAEEATKVATEAKKAEAVKTTSGATVIQESQDAALKAQKEKEIAATQAAARSSYKDHNTSLSSVSGLNGAILNEKAQGTGMSGLGEAFMAAERNYGVNAGFLFSLAVIESGWGNSGMASQDNNLFGFGSKSFSSKEACIDYVAQFIGESYLSSNGKFFKGGTLSAVNTIYCPASTSWSDKIMSVWNGL